MSSNYYYAQNGRQSGPISLVELQSLLRGARLAPSDLVWTEGMSDWKPAAEVPGLIPATPSGSAATVPQPPPVVVRAPPVQQPARSSAPTSADATASVASPAPKRAAGDAGRQVLSNTIQTATVTGRHLGRVAAYAAARGKIQLSQREARRTQAVLGQKMYAAGLGDVKARQVIHELEERICSLKAANSSTKPVEEELRAAQFALAEPALAGDRAPPGIEAEVEAARDARRGTDTAQHAADSVHSDMRSLQAQHGLRLGIGYLVALLCLTGIVWMGWGSGKGKQPPESQNDPTHDVGDVSGNGSGSVFPVDEGVPSMPPAGVVSQTSFCVNCGGTGQANCLQCFGTGKRTCFNCNGTGRAVNNMPCFQCNSTGRQNCSFCAFGKVQCSQCLGTGRR